MKNMQICASIKSADAGEVVSLCRKYPFVEVRLDNTAFSDAELKEIFSVQNCRKIVCCRPCEISSGEKVKLLSNALACGADIVDVEYDFELADLLAYGVVSKGKKLIVSGHFYDELPDDDLLHSLVEKASSIGADFLKIAASCANPVALLRFWETYIRGVGNFPIEKTLFVPMGKGTELARLAALNMGSPFMYVSCDGRQSTVDGQIPYSLVEHFLENI